MASFGPTAKLQRPEEVLQQSTTTQEHLSARGPRLVVFSFSKAKPLEVISGMTEVVGEGLAARVKLHFARTHLTAGQVLGRAVGAWKGWVWGFAS